MITIDKQFLKSLNPCSDRYVHYCRHYADWSGTLGEFLDLDHLSVDDRLWVFSRDIPNLAPIQREFALAVSSRAVDGTDKQEIKDFWILNALIVHSGEFDIRDGEGPDRDAYWDAYWAADWDAYWAADRAADWAADWQKERAVQLEMLKQIVRESK